MPILPDPDTTSYHFEVKPQIVHNYFLIQFECAEYTLKHVTSNSYAEALTPSVAALGGGASKEVIKEEALTLQQN